MHALLHRLRNKEHAPRALLTEPIPSTGSTPLPDEILTSLKGLAPLRRKTGERDLNVIGSAIAEGAGSKAWLTVCFFVLEQHPRLREIGAIASLENFLFLFGFDLEMRSAKWPWIWYERIGDVNALSLIFPFFQSLAGAFLSVSFNYFSDNVVQQHFLVIVSLLTAFLL